MKELLADNTMTVDRYLVVLSFPDGSGTNSPTAEEWKICCVKERIKKTGTVNSKLSSFSLFSEFILIETGVRLLGRPFHALSHVWLRQCGCLRQRRGVGLDVRFNTFLDR